MSGSPDRMMDLEIKVTYQERLLLDLDEVVTGQNQTIDALERRLTRLEERLRAALASDEA